MMSRIRSVSMLEVSAQEAAEDVAGCRLTHQPRNMSFFGRPDYANRRKAVLVFVNGCFWHGHSCRGGKIPKTNSAFWKAKFDRNKRRHALVLRRARLAGYKVYTLWECRLKRRSNVR